MRKSEWLEVVRALGRPVLKCRMSTRHHAWERQTGSVGACWGSYEENQKALIFMQGLKIQARILDWEQYARRFPLFKDFREGKNNDLTERINKYFEKLNRWADEVEKENSDGNSNKA